MKPAIRNVFSLCGAIVVQVCGFHEWQAMGDIMDIVKMKGMACQTPEDPVVKMTCLSTMWAGKGIEAVGFAKNQDCVTENITSMAQAGESRRESDQQDCAAITENMTSLAETKSKARVMVDCSTLDCVVDGMPALNHRCCQKPCGSCIGKNIMSISGLSKEQVVVQAGESRRESDQQDCAAITENMTSLAETKSKARVMVDCSTLDCVVDGMPALNHRCCQKQSAVKEYTKKMGGGQSNLFGCDTWWLWLVISICVVQGCWKWTDGGSVPSGRGWWLTMASLVAVAEGLADTWYQLSPSGGFSGSHNGGVSVWSTADNRMYVFGGTTGSYINTLIAYDPQANAWETISPSSGTAPSARGYSAGAWDWTNGRMWIFGGGSNGVKYNDLHYYDVQANQWVEVSPGGTAPTARYFHAAGFDSTNSRMWVFGGYDDTGNNKNDLHYYDVTANQWVEVTPGGTAPTARYGQRAEWDDAGGRLWIFAGNDDTGAVNDLFYYDLQANAWVEVTPGGVTPGVRNNHHSAIDASAGRLYIYGGAHDGGVTLLYVEIEDQTTTTTVSSSATRTSTSSATRTITTTTSQTISSTTTGTASTTGTTTTTRTGSTTTTASSSTSTSTTTISRTSTSTTISSSTSTSTTTSRSASTSSTSSTSSTTTTSTTSTSTSTTSTSTSRSATTSSSSSTRSTSTTSTTATSTRTSKTMSTTSSTSTTTTTSTQSSTTTASLTTSTATHTTATDSTTTTSSISSSTTSPTTTTKTGTAIPEGGLTTEELEALEEKRKEEAAQAVAAVEAAENNAVAEAIAAIALQGNASASAPGILGEVTISSEAGPVKVAALSLEALGNDSVPVKVSAGETGAELEVSAGLLGEVAAAAGSDVVLLSAFDADEDHPGVEMFALFCRDNVDNDKT